MGAGHLCLETSLYRSLKDAGISYLVLLPNQTLFDEIRSERNENWELILEVDTENSTDDQSTKFYLSPSMQSFFEPDVRAIIQSPDIIITKEWIAETFQDGAVEYEEKVSFCFCDLQLTEGFLDRASQPMNKHNTYKFIRELLEPVFERLMKRLLFKNIDRFEIIPQANASYTLKLICTNPSIEPAPFP